MATVDLVVDEAADRTGATTVGDTIDALTPNTNYSVDVLVPGRDALLAQCRFRTTPTGAHDTPGRVAIAVMSCHQPFDDAGEVDARATCLLDDASEILAREDVSRVIMMGDQVYTDLPKSRSLFDAEHFATVAPAGRADLLACTREEIRRLLHARYRAFWSPTGMRALQSGWASDLILDDHEIVDNFGSAPEHATPRFGALRAGALDAYYDYQASRTLRLVDGHRPASFHRCWRHGSIATFVMDLRSERRRRNDRIEVYADAQHRALARFLEDSRACHVVMLGLSVPLLHVPDWIADLGVLLGGEGSDAADRWSYQAANECRDRLLELLRRHQRDNPAQRIVLMGGDIHVGLASRMMWSDEMDTRDADGCIFQVVSSAISNRYSPLMQQLASLAPRSRALVGRSGDAIAFGELMPGTVEAKTNPCGDLNLAIIEVWRESAKRSKLRFKLYGHGGQRPHLAFDSGLV